MKPKLTLDFVKAHLCLATKLHALRRKEIHDLISTFTGIIKFGLKFELSSFHRLSRITHTVPSRSTIFPY
jgi:hypothetical protein